MMFALLTRLASAILLTPTDVIEQALLPMMAPLPKSWKGGEHRQWAIQVMNEYWNNTSGYEVQASDDWIVNNGGGDNSCGGDKTSTDDVPPAPSFRPSTYGEITADGA
jgi:hypothetical protein